MNFDYDLTVIGTTPAAIKAALETVALEARVALVTQELPPKHENVVKHHAFLRTVYGEQSIVQNHSQNYRDPNHTEPGNWRSLCAQIQKISSIWTDSHPIEALTRMGIDVIVAAGRFQHDRQTSANPQSSNPQSSKCKPSPVVFEVGRRSLRSRRYLLALAGDPQIPDIPGLVAIDYLTPETLFTQSWDVLPKRWLILAGTLQSFELAQALTRLGCQVTLVVSTVDLLVDEDVEMVLLLQAYLESEGIRVLTETLVRQFKPIEGEIWVQTDQAMLVCDVVMVATGYGVDLAALNLEHVMDSGTDHGTAPVRFAIPRIQAEVPTANPIDRRATVVQLNVDRHLRTLQPQIYACGEILGGYAAVQLAEYEASIAMQNALFWPWRTVNYAQIPYGIVTEQQWVRVGLTEVQARQCYGKDLWVLRTNFQRNLQAQLQGRSIGLCKVLVRLNGEILGAHILGPEAMEWIGTLSLALQQRIKIQAWERLPIVSPSFAEVMGEILAQWQYKHRERSLWKQDVLRGFFNWQRTGNV